LVLQYYVNGEFSLYIRAYWPDVAIANGTWTPRPRKSTMLEWTAGAPLMGLVHHDDTEREWAYDHARGRAARQGLG
jgi:hypothetical protein